jgi:trigger factor
VAAQNLRIIAPRPIFTLPPALVFHRLPRFISFGKNLNNEGYMKSNLEKKSTLERKLNIQVPAEVVGSTFDKMFKKVQKDANIKGFRPGKAPITTIKSMYGAHVAQDVVNDIIQKHYHQALQEHSLDPINYPEFEFDAPEVGKEFSFSAIFEVRPEVTLKKYEGLEVEKEKAEFDEARIEQVLTNIRNSRAQQVPVLEDRPAQNGDTAIIDFDGYVDGKPLDGGKGTDHSLELGTKSFIDGFEEGVVGMKIGANKTLNLKFPDPYHSKDLAGKGVEFKVTLKKLMKKDLPELNDEFLKSIGANQTVEELKATIRKDLDESQAKQIEQDFKNRMLKQLVKANPVEVPASLLKDQKQALVDDMKKKMLDEGLSDEEFADYVTKWDGDFSTTASEMIQVGFIIDAIAAKHELRATKEDVEVKIAEYSKQTGLDVAKIEEHYSRPEQMQRLSYMITEEKVLDLLTKSAKIKEMPRTKIKESAN